MASILYKWLLIASIGLFQTKPELHPVYMSVTEIEHNASEKTLEISCKIYTDDFEKTLRSNFKTHVDLLKPADKKAMEKLVSDYIGNHLKIIANGKSRVLLFKGFEQVEEAIYSYFQVDDIPLLNNISITDNILYDYKSEQISLLHITVNGNRRSTKLVNPDDKVTMQF